MRFEREQVTKVNKEAARHISAGDGLWLKEMANLPSFLADLQHHRQLTMTHELNRFCRERLSMLQKTTL
jgi:hypothetical protein